MKRLLYHLLFGCMFLLLMAACEADTIPFDDNTDVSNCITLQLETSSVPVRAAAAIEGAGKENVVNHLDIFVFQEDGNLFHKEQLQWAGDKAILTKKRSAFASNTPYFVYVVANSSVDFSDVQSLDNLKGKIQENEAIHLTGLNNVENVPQSFLMDGIATVANNTASSDKTVILNDGVMANHTELEVSLKRAAAKLIVHMKKGDKVEFSTTPGQDGAVYYMRNLPYASTVLDGVNDVGKTRTSRPISTDYFDWQKEEVKVTAYAYSHNWEKGSTLEKEPRLIVNIPLTYTPNTDQGGEIKSVKYENSYYQIPISRDKQLNRNTCYEVTVTINAPGGSDPSEPLKLDPIHYSVSEWVGQKINVGGEQNELAYLTLNQYEMEMHNMEDDNTTLEFASSSKVTAEITKVWYIDKFGQEKILEKKEKDQYGEKYTTGSGGWFDPVITHWKNLCTIKITPGQNITGKIHVHSKEVPENNTIRYIEFTVKNDQGITRKVMVAQYPLEYITNIQGWYSYRSDFGGTTLENKGNRTTNNSYFKSKVAEEIKSGYNRGKSDIYGYSWSKWSTSVNDRSENIYTGRSAGNARMYHVVISATSSKYTLGIPRLDKQGYTEKSSANNVIVSPSFMLASQLGALSNVVVFSQACNHCLNYVETYKDEDGRVIHLDDWRLPTRAELEIIIKYQYSSDAMDEVIRRKGYWCADGRYVYNQQGLDGNGYIRCIRDAYDMKTGK